MSKSQGVIVPECHVFQNRPNWVLRERAPLPSVKSERTRKYFELEEHVDEKGFRGEVLVEKDYPITPEYVTSFAAGADYHQDPVGAIANAPKRSNLGDITALQRALGLDYETARHLFSEFRAAAKRAAEKLSTASSGQDSSASAGSEVKE